MKIVLIAGLAQHGKDSSAHMIRSMLEEKGKKSIIIKYGDYLKFVAKEYFGWDGEKDKKGRTLLQTLGTEKGRANNPNMWVNVVCELIKGIGSDYDFILIPDFRYPNEETVLRENGFKIFTIWVCRDGFDNGLTEEQKNHPSETSLLDWKFDRIICVGQGLYKLKDALRTIVQIDKFFK